MSHHCHVPARTKKNPWVCPVCRSPWTITPRATAAKSRRENIRVNGHQPWFFGRP